ncbi:MAG: flagellar biosynthetic protein FliR [Betaproteobacteria bacterium]
MISVTTAQWYAWIAAFAWPFFRILGLIISEPILGNANIPSTTKVGLAVFLTLVLAPVLPPMPTVDPASAAGVFIAFQQLLIGLAIGFTLRVALTAAETAGQLIGLQMGLGFAVFFDPQSSAQTAVMGQFVGMFAMLTFLAMDGHLMVVTALSRSFTTLPISLQPLASGGLLTMARSGGEIFSTGLLISLPVVTALLIANIAVGIMTRAAPQLNIFAVGFPITLAVGFFGFWLAIPFMGPAIQNMFEQALIATMRVAEQFASIPLPAR